MIPQQEAEPPFYLKRNNIIIASAVMIFLVTGLVFIWLQKNSFSPQVQERRTNNIPVMTGNKEIKESRSNNDDIAGEQSENKEVISGDWKTYVSKEYDFSLTLPIFWKEIIDDAGGGTGDIRFDSNSFILVGKEKERIYINIWDKESAPACEGKDWIDCYMESADMEGREYEKKEIILNDIPTVEIGFTDKKDPVSFSSHRYILSGNDKIIILSVSEKNEITDKIIKSANFIKNVKNSDSGKSNYLNFGISLSYPSELINKDNAFYTKDNLDGIINNRTDDLYAPELDVSSKQNISIDSYILQSINPNYKNLFESQKADIKKDVKYGESIFTEVSNKFFDEGGCLYFLELKSRIVRFSTIHNCGADNRVNEILKSVKIN